MDDSIQAGMHEVQVLHLSSQLISCHSPIPGEVVIATMMMGPNGLLPDYCRLVWWLVCYNNTSIAFSHNKLIWSATYVFPTRPDTADTRQRAVDPVLRTYGQSP